MCYHLLVIYPLIFYFMIIYIQGCSCKKAEGRYMHGTYTPYADHTTFISYLHMAVGRAVKLVRLGHNMS